MSKFFDDTMQGLLQAIEIEKGNIPLTERKGMPASTLLAKMTGNTQQAISRFEKKNHSPSLQTFCNILDALGYGIVIEKKATI